MDTQMAVKVTAVTVYPDRARVRCQGTGSLDAGAHVLVIDELPLAMEPDSLRAQGHAAASARLLGVEVSRQHYATTPAAQVRELETAIEALQDRLKELKDEEGVLLEHGQYLAGMRRATEVYAKGLALGRSSVDDQAALHEFLRREDTATRAGLRDLSLQARSLERELEKRRNELAALQSMRPRQRYQARVDVELSEAAEFTLSLSYVVRQAGWKPLYDARLEQDDGDWRFSLTALAQVQQETGQDWSAVDLTLSTARPALNQQLPALQPWYVDVHVPRPPRPQADLMPSAGTGLAKMAAMVADAELPAPPRAAEEVFATADDAGLAVEYHVDGRIDVPSDGSTRKTTLGRFAMRPDLDYLTAPRHTSAVFRRVKVRNETPGPLLPGTINLFAGDEFIGSSQMSYAPRGDEIELMFGVEDRLTVTRELVRRDVDKRLLRDRRQLHFGYEIKLTSLLAVDAAIELTDQIPVSRDERIAIRLNRCEPQPAESSELNLLTWRFGLEAGAEWQLRYDFSVEHPRDLTIVGLHI